MDKLRKRVKLDKHLLIFLMILLIVGIIVGAVFVTILNESDQTLITEYLNSFLGNIENNKLNYISSFKNSLISNIIFVLIIWLLGISIIGLPIMIFMYFSKIFVLGFSIGSIIVNFHLKGIMFALVYSLGQALFLFGLIILMIYAMSFSFKLIDCFFKKKTFDFKLVINKYTFILGIILIVSLIASLYDSYLLPLILKSIVSFIR